MGNKSINPKVILITGTSEGIGYFLAKYYIKKEYVVVGCSRSDCDINNSNYYHIKGDISKEESILEIFRFIRSRFSRLDVVINNAAVNPAILNIAFLPYNTIENIYRINVMAPIFICREAVKLMIRNKSGRIINIGSMATKHEVAGEALYTSTKSSLNAFTRVLAKEVYKYGITANVISPSIIDTKLSRTINKEAIAVILSRNVIHEYGEFTDVSNSIDFLLCESSKCITGQLIYLGGV